MIKLRLCLPKDVVQVANSPVVPRKGEFIRYQDQLYRVTKITYTVDMGHVPVDVQLESCSDSDLLYP